MTASVGCWPTSLACSPLNCACNAIRSTLCLRSGRTATHRPVESPCASYAGWSAMWCARLKAPKNGQCSSSMPDRGRVARSICHLRLTSRCDGNCGRTERPLARTSLPFSIARRKNCRRIRHRLNWVASVPCSVVASKSAESPPAACWEGRTAFSLGIGIGIAPLSPRSAGTPLLSNARIFSPASPKAPELCDQPA